MHIIIQGDLDYVNDGAHNELVQKCSELQQLNDIKSHRISYLCHA